MLVAFIMSLPASFIFVVSFFALIFSLYTYDNKNHVQRFIVSLPVSKKDIIRGRYIYSVCTVIFLLLILWVWMGLLSLSPLLTDNHYVYNWRDRKSTRLNSSHVAISYAVFCLKNKM